MSSQFGGVAEGFSVVFRDLRVSVPATHPESDSCCASCCNRHTEAPEMDVIKGVDGVVAAGQLLCILGPSGAGKTTLLDVLAGRHKAGRVTGSIAFSGGSRSPFVQSRTGYVMQDDALHPLLTVRETLMFSSRLRVPADPSISIEEDQRLRQAKIDDIIRVLRLQRVADSRIGNAEKRGLSGGERRRVSIGEQLVHSPKILFCDEVTSGLDAANARRVVLALRDLSRTGCTVMCTLHQPSSVVFALTDRLLLLQSGQAAYFGPTLHSLTHFKSLNLCCPTYLNPADYLLDLVESGQDEADDKLLIESDVDQREDEAWRDVQDRLNQAASTVVSLPHSIELTSDRAVNTDSSLHTTLKQQASLNLPAAFHQSESQSAMHHEMRQLAPLIFERENEFAATSHLQDSSHGPLITSAVSESERIRVLTHRAWLSTVRDPAVMYFRTGAACGIAALIGVIFFQTSTNVVNALLFLMCVFSLFCLPAITRYTEDRLIFSREYAGGYSSPLAYSISGFLVELPILMITIIIYGLIVYFLVGFRSGGLHFPAFLLIVFLVVNVCFAKAQMLSAISPSTNAALAFFMVILVYSLLLGGFMITASQLPSGIQWLVYSSYFYFGFNALLLNQYLGVDDPQKNLLNLEFQNDVLWIDLVALVLFLLAFRLIGFAGLKFLHRERR